MARAFSRICFTTDVKAVQQQWGSRELYRQVEVGEPEVASLSDAECGFIAACDSFVIATVGQNGWPYVQHRGGPAGFLKVVDAHTIGFADYSGNRQYISVGNLCGDDRVSLLLVDYAHQRRLKIWGRARIVDESKEARLMANLETPGFNAPVERGLLITIEAVDWNCPKYIPVRHGEHDCRTRPAVAAAANGQLFAPITGTGPLALTVAGIRQLTPGIRAYELMATDGAPLPLYRAGAHLRVPVLLPDGSLVTRSYSLTEAGSPPERYCIAVLRLQDGTGGSRAVHDTWQLGSSIQAAFPANHFSLHDDARPALLIAGGIGITPLRAMAQELSTRGVEFVLHYAGCAPGQMAFHRELSTEFPGQMRFHYSRTAVPTPLDALTVLREAHSEAVIYTCGPARLLQAVRQAARQLNIPNDRLHFESFT